MTSSASRLHRHVLTPLTARVLATLGAEVAVRYLRNPDPRVSAPLLRLCGARIGTRTRIKRTLFLDNTVESSDCAGDFRNLTLGHNCYVGDLVYLDLAANIHVEDDVVISEGVAILTHSDCNRSAELARLFPRKTAAVTIGTGAWLGAGAIVLSGVQIGERSVIAAGSVVTSAVEPWSVYAGAPARKIRTLEPGAPVTPV